MLLLTKHAQALEDAKKLRIENKALKDKMKERESNGTELVMSKLREKDALRKHNALNDRSQELKKTLEAKCDEAKKREMEAMAKRDATLARLEKLQMQMQVGTTSPAEDYSLLTRVLNKQMQQKAYEELNVKYNEVQKDSEYFALLAQVRLKAGFMIAQSRYRLPWYRNRACANSRPLLS